MALTRLLIANRGEIALRIIRACRELAIESVAVYSDADVRSPHVLAADRAIRIGPAPASESYLSIAALIDAARAVDADAVHPGYGFLSENPAFAAACVRAGFIFVGPPAAVMMRMGSKVEARRVMHEAGIPIVPGETPADQTDHGVGRAVEQVGFPALIKASAGGGGKGMRRVDDATQVLDAIQAARREALAAFDDGTLYVERAIDRPHHVEVQVMADDHGGVVHVFERECSVQRRHQKVIEETPSPFVTPALRTAITDAAVRAARAVEYRGAGTIEFLVEPAATRAAARFYFLEMNTRLQVEHPVTELVAGVDLVHAQLAVAAGDPLPWTQAQLSQRGHAIEARVYAESPARGFVPQAGRLLLFREPRHPGVRVDAGVVEGDDVSVHYDPLLAKVIAHAETRAGAIERLRAALESFPVLGIETNIGFLLAILRHAEFHAGRADTGFLDRSSAQLLAEIASDRMPEVVKAALAAAGEDDGAASGVTGPHPAAGDPWQRLGRWGRE